MSGEAKFKEYFDTLDLAYRAVDALGGTGASAEYNEALDAALMCIFHLGGDDPALRQKKGYPEGKPAGDDDNAYFRTYMFSAGQVLSIQDAADIQTVLSEHNDLIGESADQYHAAYQQALLDIGGPEMVAAKAAADEVRMKAHVAHALSRWRAAAAEGPQ